MSRFHTPLIEPDGRYSRIRLSEETSRFRPQKAARPLRKPNKTKRIVQGFVRKSPGRRPCHFVFGTQPLTQPLAGMSFHCPIGFADRSKTEVIGPTVHHLVEFPHHRLMIRLGSISSRFATDRLTDADHSLLGRNRAQIPAARGVVDTFGLSALASVRPTIALPRMPRCPRTFGCLLPRLHRWLCSICRQTSIRPSGTPCRTAHRSESQAISSLYRVTLPVTSERLLGLLGSSPIPPSLSLLALVSN